MKLIDILDPTPIPTFLRDYFGIQPLHVTGNSERFAELRGGSLDVGFAPVVALTQNLERDLEAPVVPEPDTTWLNAPLHRSQHDVIALQIGGQNLWRIHGKLASGPSAEASFEACLNAGDVVYIPNGYWCMCTGQTGTSEALALAVHYPTGADVLRWLAEKLEHSEPFQTDVPRFAGPDVQADYLTNLQMAVAGAFRMPNLIDRYFRRLNCRRVRVPVEQETWDWAEAGRYQISIAAPRYPKIYRQDKETIRLTIGGSDLHLPSIFAQLVQYLLDCAPVPLAAFRDYFEREFKREELTEFLKVMAEAGVIAMSRRETTH